GWIYHCRTTLRLFSMLAPPDLAMADNLPHVLHDWPWTYCWRLTRNGTGYLTGARPALSHERTAGWWRLHRSNRHSGRRSATSSVSSLSFMTTRKVLRRRKLVLPQSLRQRSFMAFPDGR